jgi:hypothetical protein
MFNTLQDHTFHVKGMGYILAGIVLFVFVFFWIFLTKKVTRKDD